MTATEERAEGATPAPLPTVVKLPGDIRRFSNPRIQEAINRQLAAVPADATVAFVAQAFKGPTDKELQTKLAVWVYKGAWSFGGYVEGNQTKPLQTVGAELRWDNGRR